MNKLLKRILSGAVAASMVIGTLVLPAAAEVTDDDLLVNITFDETAAGSGTFTATKGGAVTENGTVSYVETYSGNKALSIGANAAGNYLELPKGILNGREAATFSFMLKPSSGWPFMTTPVSSQTYLSEKYLGMLATETALTAERYNNSGTRLSSVTASGDFNKWQYVTVVFEADGTKLYIDGELAASDTAAVNISELFTSTASTWIGHGNWGSGEGFSGMIDDFRIYGTALSAEDIASLAADYADYNQKNLLYENNSIVFDTHFYDHSNIFDDEQPEIFSIGENIDTVKVKVTIKNYIADNDESFRLNIYAVNAAGEETKLSDFVETYVGSGDTGEHSLSFDPDAISDSVKYIIKETAFVKMNEEYTVGEIYLGVKSPVAAPADSNSTTIGAHDPSIVKFPNDDTYYVYSSHHLIFTSEDLVNWKKYDFTNIDAKEISPITNAFITANYTNTTMNGTYWAPDVIYKEGDAHPYWMYISVSCGLGGRNSVISLMKSDSPLFWADSEADIVDAGIVFATKEASGYITNSIDANIYTDTQNGGNQYFIWGSFWGGIQAAPLKSDGFVEGIDYTSDTTILNTCKNFGTSVFTQRNGVAGPEGAWMIEHGDYRYMFTSYGWLGSNYNTRVARAPLSSAFGTNLTALTDANGVAMATEYSKGSTSNITGYKLIGSYRLGDGSMTIEGTGSNYYVPRGSNDAHIYYGPGHNSVINAGDETFYISHIRKDGVDITATLEARKVLFTSDGWPVVSPVSYAGEKEQALPEEMLLGTYDLASVGHTKFAAGSSSIASSGSYINRNYDLPVLSSKVTLNADHTLANDLGTWAFDGDHTITITFAKDGDTTLDEFYKSGDVMTMYALFGYDKDEEEPVIALTGVDQNHVTQFAKKAISSVYETAEPVVPEPIVIEKSSNNNPILGFNSSGLMYAGDPAAMVEGDTVYIYAGHDTSTSDGYVMPEWVCYSSKDMINWKYEGVTMKATDISWRNDNTSAWASQVIKHNDKYYMYYCTWDKTSSGKQSIGVAVSDSPTGPFTDPLSAPIVKGTLTEPQTSNWNDIDPTVWIETVDGVEHRYLAWGNGIFYICELNDDMISVKDLDGDGSITMNGDIKQQVFSSLPGGAGFTEAPWLYRQQDENGNYYGKYYMFGAFGWREQMGYVTSDSIWGPWEAGEILMPPTATSNTNHPAVIDFNGKTYFIYHNGSLPWGSGFRRVVCVEEFKINEDGTIDPIPETSTGLGGTASIITHNGDYVYYEHFTNSSGDDDYPITAKVSVGMTMKDMADTYWEIVPGKADTSNENYISIQAVNKPGLYLQANSDKSVVLTQDATQDTSGSVKKQMTFITIKALNGDEDGISFESVSQPGYYLTYENGSLTLTKGTNTDAATFNIDLASNAEIPSLLATVDKVWHENNETVHYRLNNAAVYGTVNAYVAEYDKDSGKLIGVAIDNNISVTSASQFFDIDYVRKSENSRLKLYIWKHMQPVAASVEVTETTSPYQVPDDYTSYFAFDETLTDAVANGVGTLTATNIDGTASASSASYSDGYNGKAVSFSGEGSYGVNLGKVITNSSYTLSFRMKANAFTQFTSALFVDSGSKSSENWLSAPFGSQSGGNTMIWSKSNGSYVTLSSSAVLNTNEWYMVTVTVSDGNAVLYIDGSPVGSGSVALTTSSSTNTYLGVNYWDKAFNGLIDDLYIYNGTALTAEQVEGLYFATAQ